ncbi:hypothetical protein JX265_005990 [Neoarthrinium moseri]|uniref:SnoaL-like domain-containing protein n=1 Tax=Neoarthrinium moseri TaxID=1658444 RepID=A0A9P9WM99_9PEZI|nr:hypothetical protein JX266_000452 [Neoarthrinium moseri]KAI1870950.1 hypothetical protein JX265_005990 [Neoarthrinium moseri]
MASSYDIQTYLLDRANVEDVLLKQVLFYDHRDEKGLKDEVYAPECIIDYTVMFGGEPLKTTNEEWAAEAIKIVKTLDASQHVNAGILVQLPQPGAKSRGRPDKCTAISNGNGHMVREAADGGPNMHTGGKQEYELVRLPELEAKGENPWRITKQKFIPVWSEGNSEVTALMQGSAIAQT